MSDLVGNPEDRFSRVAALMIEDVDNLSIMRNSTFHICKNKDADQLRSKLISVFASLQG